jgi:hypothetical protein
VTIDRGHFLSQLKHLWQGPTKFSPPIPLADLWCDGVLEKIPFHSELKLLWYALRVMTFVARPIDLPHRKGRCGPSPGDQRRTLLSGTILFTGGDQLGWASCWVEVQSQSAVQYSAVQCSAVQCSAVQCSTVQHKSGR